MKLIPKDPDIRTLVARIREANIDLQPDFQRGVVWSVEKQQRLIDSILRDWHVPPIHLISEPDERLIVLDGQQRLTAIYRFFENGFPIDGSAQPWDEQVSRLDGFFYRDLPPDIARRIERFTVRVFEIIDYKAEEPYELFFRLNQMTALTSAEKRNAFFGPAREQIKDLVALCEQIGLSKKSIGFSNSRMAYDDSLARFCVTLENGTLRDRVSATDITERYRSGTPFADKTIERAKQAVLFLFLRPDASENDEFLILNKATFHSYLCFIARVQQQVAVPIPTVFRTFVEAFDSARRFAKEGDPTLFEVATISRRTTASLLAVFNDRATSRVSDVSSVLLRDVVLWMCWKAMAQSTPATSSLGLLPSVAARMDSLLSRDDISESDLLEFIDDSSWGVEL